MLGKIAAAFSAAALFAYSRQVYATFGLPKMVVLVAGLSVMAVALAGGAGVEIKRPLHLAGALFLAACWLSTLFAADKWLAIVGSYNSYALGLLGVSVVLAYAVCASSADEDWTVGLFSLSGVVLGLIAFYQWGSGTGFILGSRATGTIGNPVELGIVLAMLLPLALSRSKVYALAVCLGLFACGSRGGWLAAAVGVSAWLIAERKALWVIPCAFLLAPFVIKSHAGSDLQHRMLWRSAGEIIDEHPILGVGPENFQAAFEAHKPTDWAMVDGGSETAINAHDDILHVWATVGIIGLAAYFLVCLEAIKTGAVVFGSLVALFVNAKVSPVPLEALVMAGVLCGAAIPKTLDKCALPTWGRTAFCAFALLALSLVGNLALADYYENKGDLASMQKACQLNPHELTYKISFIQRGVSEYNRTSSPELRSLIVSEIRHQALEAQSLRPAAVDTRRIAETEADLERQLRGS